MKIHIPDLPDYSPYWKEGKLTHAILNKEFVFYLTIKGRIRRFVIPTGFTWDGNSIPKLFWMFTGTPWAMDLLCAGLIHDWLYRTGKVTRQLADQIHRHVMRSHGVGAYRSGKMHLALRCVGWIAWKQHRN
tara:strand:+ start:137 stop:529 length:393 start_codon:yes stop_codon:yes gene_type:complete